MVKILEKILLVKMIKPQKPGNGGPQQLGRIMFLMYKEWRE